MIYSVVLLLCTVLFFRSSTLGVIAISQMAAGDGIADIIGRKYGKVKWSFAKSKSIVGSAAFVVGGFVCSLTVLSWLHYTGKLNHSSFIFCYFYLICIDVIRIFGDRSVGYFTVTCTIRSFCSMCCSGTYSRH